ncbi:hypothetical protein, partial [Endozoicomonas sp. ALE010]|uniref:hypothetical protein n=1 Tax=Endozoicomonas sp. ALE010 TaxID=3403081 RepID=UPI003BB523C2
MKYCLRSFSLYNTRLFPGHSQKIVRDQQNKCSLLTGKCGLKMGCLEMNEKQPVDKSNWRGKMR